MPNIKLRDGSGVEQVYEGVDTISVPLADGSGTFVYGLTDEQLNLSDGNSHYYTFAKGSPLYREDYFKDNYIIKRANMSNIDTPSNSDWRAIAGLFNENEYITDLRYINISGTRLAIEGMFNGCTNLLHIPNISLKDVNANRSFGIFEHCYKLQNGELEKFFGNVEFSNTFQNCPFRGCYSITNLDLSVIDVKSPKMMADDYFSYDRLVSDLYNLRSLKFPSKLTGTLTSSSYGLRTISGLHMLSSLTFNTNADGTPFKVKMKNQSFNLTGEDYYNYTGYFTNYSDYNVIEKGTNPPDPTHNVFYNIKSSSDLTVEKIKEEYNRVKGFDDWHAYYSSSITYNGKSVPAARLVSRFNHDSIVGFINTLPDTSEYLATAGGTNTIKLNQFQGDLTDGGGVSNLTEEEIAVAAAKGWTISIV